MRGEYWPMACWMATVMSVRTSVMSVIIELAIVVRTVCASMLFR